MHSEADICVVRLCDCAGYSDAEAATLRARVAELEHALKRANTESREAIIQGICTAALSGRQLP